MNDNNQSEKPELNEKASRKKEMSRRQFLSYTLGGTGGFLGAAMLVPMVRFAVDPLLEPQVKAGWVKVVELSKVTKVPQSFGFKVHQVDGWYESDVTLQAYIVLGSDGKPFALSPICKHLGCTVKWAGDPAHPDEYACPCHGAHYTENGKQLVVAPLPLDQYDLKIENGSIYLGSLHANALQNKEAKA